MTNSVRYLQGAARSPVYLGDICRDVTFVREPRAVQQDILFPWDLQKHRHEIRARVQGSSHGSRTPNLPAMSMFRKPGESSSSSSEDESSDHREVTEASLDDALLSRINTLDSAQSALSASGPSVQVASGPPPVFNVRDLALHSLLEDKATAEAAEHLGKDKADPEVQELARKTYRGLAQQLSGTTSDIYSSDEMKEQRAVAREGIHNATRFQLAGRAGATDASPIAATAAIAEASQAMIPRSILGQTGDQNINVETLPGLQSPVPIPVPLFLQGYPGLNTDRYTRDYEEFELVGKGGYGKVYKVKHKLDNSFYAVKKIIVSPSKMQKIQEQGPQELESLLGEVRSLAGFDHGNIVRYHSAWLEFSAACASAPLSTSNVALGPKRLLPSPSGPSFSASDTDHLRTSFENASLLEEDTHDSGADIMFENSDSGTGAENPESGVPGPPSIEGMSRRANRRGSEATIITISSTHSHLSTVEEAVHEDEEDVEVIPRTHSPTLEESDSMMSNRCLYILHILQCLLTLV
jgi:translation initiation factor 2-alpha kinase 3